jgi:hypothetical protein
MWFLLLFIAATTASYCSFDGCAAIVDPCSCVPFFYVCEHTHNNFDGTCVLTPAGMAVIIAAGVILLLLLLGCILCISCCCCRCRCIPKSIHHYNHPSHYDGHTVL